MPVQKTKKKEGNNPAESISTCHLFLKKKVKYKERENLVLHRMKTRGSSEWWLDSYYNTIIID